MAAAYAFTSIHIKGSSRALRSMIGASIRYSAGKGEACKDRFVCRTAARDFKIGAILKSFVYVKKGFYRITLLLSV